MINLRNSQQFSAVVFSHYCDPVASRRHCNAFLCRDAYHFPVRHNNDERMKWLLMLKYADFS